MIVRESGGMADDIMADDVLLRLGTFSRATASGLAS
jgi:hypothetical protein